jgi:hypothetical protein
MATFGPKMAKNCQKMTKNAIFLGNGSFFKAKLAVSEHMW